MISQTTAYKTTTSHLQVVSNANATDNPSKAAKLAKLRKDCESFLPVPKADHPGVHRVFDGIPLQPGDSAEIYKWLMKQGKEDRLQPREICEIMGRIQDRDVAPEFVPPFDLQPPYLEDYRDWNFFHEDLVTFAFTNKLTFNVAVSTRTPEFVGGTLTDFLGRAGCNIREFKLTTDGPVDNGGVQTLRLEPFMQELAQCPSIEVMGYDMIWLRSALPIPPNVRRLELGGQMDDKGMEDLYRSLCDRSPHSALETVVHECGSPESSLKVAKAVSDSNTQRFKEGKPCVKHLVLKGPGTLPPELSAELAKTNITVVQIATTSEEWAQRHHKALADAKNCIATVGSKELHSFANNFVDCLRRTTISRQELGHLMQDLADKLCQLICTKAGVPDPTAGPFLARQSQGVYDAVQDALRFDIEPIGTTIGKLVEFFPGSETVRDLAWALETKLYKLMEPDLKYLLVG